MHLPRLARNPFPAPKNPGRFAIQDPDTGKARVMPSDSIGKPKPIPESECNPYQQPWERHDAKLEARPRLFPQEREARRENARRALTEMAQNAS